MFKKDFNLLAILLFTAMSMSGQTLLHNFEFNGNLDDTRPTGVSLIEVNTATSSYGTSPNSWTWTQTARPGGGLELLTNQLPDATNYSLGFTMEFDQTDGGAKGYRKIITFKGATSDNGLYFQNNKLRLYPGDHVSTSTYAANTFYDFVLTRKTDGTFKIYTISGGVVTEVFTIDDADGHAMPILNGANHEFRLFMNDNHFIEHTTGGTVRSIRMWDAALTAQEIEDALSTVLTEEATNITNTSATLNAEVNPQGSASTFEFEWGTTTAYGNTEASTPSSGSGTVSVSLSTNLSGLIQGETYHYRIKSTNGAGDTFGGDKTFVANNPPTASCQDFTAQLDGNGAVTISPSDVDNGSSDPDGAVTLSLDLDTFDCSNVGAPVLVTLTVTGIHGDTDTCTATVTVEDSIVPSIICPLNKTENSSGDYTLPDYWDSGDVTVTDNCDAFIDMTLTQSPVAGTVVAAGQHTITMTATDRSLNSSTCTFKLAVETALGIEDDALSNSIEIYPNPVVSELMIINSSNMLLKSATIYNVYGSVVYEINLTSLDHENSIDISNLATGVYFIEVRSEEASTVKRLIKS